MYEPLSVRSNAISLRTKITGVTVLLVTLGLLVAGVGTMTVLRTYLLAQVDANIGDAAKNINVSSIQNEQCVTQTDDYFVAVIAADGLKCRNMQSDTSPTLSTVSASNVWDGQGDPPTFTSWDSDRTTQWRMVAVTGTNTESGEAVALVVGQNLDETNQTITQFAAIFFGFGLSVVVLGAALTRVLVTSTFAPLRQVEATAAAIADGNFSERLPADTPNTEVGRLNQSLNTMLARIDRAFGDRAQTIDQMRRFVGDASHELRTPLVSVRGYAELYRMGALTTPEEIGQAMDRIEKEAIRMGGLVEDLLELARIDEAKPLQLGPVDLVPIAYDAASDAMASAPNREVTVVFTEPDPDAASDETDDTAVDTADPDEPESDRADAPSRTGAIVVRPIVRAGATLARLRSRRSRRIPVEVTAEPATAQHVLDVPAIVWAEENKIRQVVTNLMGNAMRFTNPGSPIEIGVGVDPVRHVATVDIIDHGDGIPPQIREKIFQRFWRADTSRTRETGGSGLGLAIVAGIVIAHQGSVEVLETEGGGATFRVVLPLLPRDESPESSTDSE